VPTLNDYTQNNITGVHAEILNITNAVIADATHAETNTIPEIQGLVDGKIAAINIISNWAEDSSTAANHTEPTLSDYEAAGVVGLTSSHGDITFANIAVSLKSQRATDTTGEIQAVIDARVSAELSILSASPQIVDLAFSNLSVITLQLKDVQGNNITGGVNYQVGMTKDSIQAFISSVESHNNGTYSASLTHNEYRDVVYVNATIQGIPITSYTFVSFADFSPPQVYSPSKVNVAENTTAVLTVKANDVGIVKYSLSAVGNDPHLFDIDSKTGVLVFKKAPNYEKPSDRWGFNAYRFTVLVTDDRNLVTAAEMMITVTDVYEPTVPFQSGQTFNGLLYYWTKASPHTGRYWLDRNLGATRVAHSIYDSKSFGYYYQWGRNDDGHQKTASSKKNTRSRVLHTNSGEFIAVTKDNFDWLDSKYVDPNGPKRLAAWNDGAINDICPRGFAVPTEAELQAELQTEINGNYSNEDAFNTFLKIPANGLRQSEGYLFFASYESYLWLRDADSSRDDEAAYFRADSGNYENMNHNHRSLGMGVRCIFVE
jgi:hypothetical protein